MKEIIDAEYTSTIEPVEPGYEIQNPRIVLLIARMVAPDESDREQLVREFIRFRAAQRDVLGEGGSWRLFALYFGEQHPGVAMFLPFSVGLYAATFYQLLGG